jgi:S1-C subfamily serine protease
LVFIWLGAALLSNTPYKGVNQFVQNSGIVQALNKALPPSPPIIARLNSLVKPLEFPQVFAGTPPKLAPPVAPAGSETVRSAVQEAGESTVRIEAIGCGGRQLGSGWVAGSRLIMTNAHVVAGTESIEVVDTVGRHRARAIYFDPGLDVAILRTSSDLAGKPLEITNGLVDRGQQSVVLGFPGGGDFTAEPSAVTRHLNAQGLNIYNDRLVTRSIYEFQGHVVQGNSGGPVVTGDGVVIGMVFAAAQDNSSFGYALTSPQLQKLIDLVGNKTSQVSVEKCS